jgi:hypothetical protein
VTQGYKHTEEAKANIAAYRKGRKHSKQALEAMAAAAKRRKQSNLTESSESKDEQPTDKFTLKPGDKGYKHTEEAKANIAAGKKRGASRKERKKEQEWKDIVASLDDLPEI